MNDDTKPHRTHHLGSLKTLQDFTKRLMYISAAHRIVGRVSTPYLQPSAEKLAYRRRVERRSFGALLGSEISTAKSEHPSNENVSAPAARALVDWWTRLRPLIAAANALTRGASPKTGNLRESDQASGLQNGNKSAETPAQSRSPKVLAPATPSNRLIPSQDLVLKLAVLPVKYQFGLDALFTKLRERVTAFGRTIPNYSELLVRNPSAGNPIGSFTSTISGPQRQASSLTVAIGKTIPSRAPGDLGGKQVRSTPITLRRTAVIATLAAPLLAAPALAAIPAAHRAPGDASCQPSIVINSTPTVVVNSYQSSDIERQVLEALKQHRDALYEQWHREVRRRQRTEF